ITARFALEQGREVFAVPGSPLDPRAEGTNELIRGGATLCASAEHVAAVLQPLIRRGETEPGQGLYREGTRGPYGEMGPLWHELDLPGLAAVEPAPLAEIDEPAPVRLEASESETILALLGAAPIPIDDLARQAELPIRNVQRALVELELDGRIDRQGANSVSLRPDVRLGRRSG
ncbi:MAG TPA: DNA-processing protein DprA, partial [Enterovirga sp.]|nr:DNA-processing protein DprA [Enterovirga sp.]